MHDLVAKPYGLSRSVISPPALSPTRCRNSPRQWSHASNRQDQGFGGPAKAALVVVRKCSHQYDAMVYSTLAEL